MNVTDFNKNWRFKFYGPSEDTPRRIPDDAADVTLPHDFRIALERTPDSAGGNSEGFYPGGFGMYEKRFELDSAGNGSRCFLDFDGVYRFAEVSVNGHLLDVHHGGYSPFAVDITDAAVNGVNTVNVVCNCAMLPASRWYTGAGIYRNVKLMKGGKDVIAPHGVSITAEPAEDGTAVICVSTEVLTGNPSYSISHRVIAPDGKEAAAGTDGKTTIDKPLLWSAEKPFLYKLETKLIINGETADAAETRFGIRRIEVDSAHGLRINGSPVKLKGGCCHHDNGVAGSVSTLELEMRKVRILKNAGFNAIRCAHNPPSTVLLEACDELGMYVIDEAFDAWHESKRVFDEHIFFDQEWEREIEAMVTRDRNHPSVIIWSTGNEIPERDRFPEGPALSKKLADKFHALDNSRPVTNALCEIWDWDKLQSFRKNGGDVAQMKRSAFSAFAFDFSAPLDITGYNYLYGYYADDLKKQPEKILCGTETFPVKAAETWLAAEASPAVIGDFVWTAWDYIGESGLGHSSFGEKDLFPRRMGFPWHLANCGDIDITGRRRPQSHYRDFVWNNRRNPYLAVRHPEHGTETEHVSLWGWPDLLESWTFPGYEGKKTRVVVYSAGDRVVIKLNGATVADAAAGGIVSGFDVEYKPGVLTAESFKNGKSLGTAELTTSGEPVALKAVLEEDSSDEMAFADLEITDAAGRIASNCDAEVSVTCSGAELVGFGGHDPVSEHNYTKPAADAVRGRLFAVFRITARNASAVFEAEGLAAAELNLLRR